MDYKSNIEFSGVANLLLGSKRVLVTSHEKPDGDAFGAATALRQALVEVGVDATAMFMPPVPEAFEELKASGDYELYEPGQGMGDYDVVVVVDTGAWSQLVPMREWLAENLDRVLVIDHHLKGDVESKWRIVDSKAAAASEIVFQLIEAIGEAAGRDDLFDATVCEGLFVGIASDTGWFRFSNASARTHEQAARLLESGVDHADLYQKLEQGFHVEKLTLMRCALDNMKLLAGGHVAMMVLHGKDFEDCGATLEQTDRLVDIPQVVKEISVVVLVTEPPRGELNGMTGDDAHSIRLSFRSKPGEGAIDVAKLASKFGGGGHARAAGARVAGELEEVVKRVEEVVDALDF